MIIHVRNVLEYIPVLFTFIYCIIYIYNIIYIYMLFNADVALMSSKFGCLHFYLVEPLDGRFNGVKNNEHVCVYPTVYTYI